MLRHPSTHATARSASLSSNVATDVRTASAAATLPALATIAFGLIVLFSVGFLQMSAVHNSVHDTRHANGFPCH